MKRTHFVVIVGCGRLGGRLADFFSGRGDFVVILDEDPDSFKLLSPEFSGFTVTGNASEFSVLKKARTADASLFIAATDNDALNIMTAKIARTHFSVPRAIARIFEPSLEEFCKEIGLEVVSPVSATAERILGNAIDYLEGAKA